MFEWFRAVTAWIRVSAPRRTFVPWTAETASVYLDVLISGLCGAWAAGPRLFVLQSLLPDTVQIASRLLRAIGHGVSSEVTGEQYSLSLLPDCQNQTLSV